MSYDATLGRFLEPDPIGYADGMNLYQFELSNPVSLLDPFGLQAASQPVDPWAGVPKDPMKPMPDFPKFPGNDRAEREQFARDMLGHLSTWMENNPNKCAAHWTLHPWLLNG